MNNLEIPMSNPEFFFFEPFVPFCGWFFFVLFCG